MQKGFSKSGFTLIELLVVISIISMLSSIVFAEINDAKKRARDVKRLEDMRNVQTALNLYFDQYERWPSFAGAFFDIGNKDNGFMNSSPWNGFNKIMDAPEDIYNTGTNGYYYATYVPPTIIYPGCPSGDAKDPTYKGTLFVLGIKGFESVVGKHPSSPGIKLCKSYEDYLMTRVGLQWVVGRYEKE